MLSEDEKYLLAWYRSLSINPAISFPLLVSDRQHQLDFEPHLVQPISAWHYEDHRFESRQQLTLIADIAFFPVSDSVRCINKPK
jgi:hypothetical protein